MMCFRVSHLGSRSLLLIDITNEWNRHQRVGTVECLLLVSLLPEASAVIIKRAYLSIIRWFMAILRNSRSSAITIKSYDGRTIYIKIFPDIVLINICSISVHLLGSIRNSLIIRRHFPVLTWKIDYLIGWAGLFLLSLIISFAGNKQGMLLQYFVFVVVLRLLITKMTFYSSSSSQIISR